MEKFYNYTQLVNWLALHQNNFYNYNSFLACTGVTDNDTRHQIEWRVDHHPITISLPRDYRIYDENFNNAYDGLLCKATRDWRYVESIEQERKTRLKTDKEWKDLRERLLPPTRRRRQFRWKHFHSCLRYSHGAHIRDYRQACDPEHQPYIRPSRNKANLPNAWDERCRRNSSGWKESTKCRHQWEPKAMRQTKATNLTLEA